jgi:hypothetical protein
MPSSVVSTCVLAPVSRSHGTMTFSPAGSRVGASTTNTSSCSMSKISSTPTSASRVLSATAGWHLTGQCNRSEDSDKVLQAAHECEKKNTLGPPFEQCRQFSPFVVHADGLLGKEAKILPRKLSAMLAEMWEKAHSEVCGCVNA